MFIEDLVKAVPPTKLKAPEVETYNPVWVDCSIENEAFVPIPNTPPPGSTKTTFRYL